MIIIQFFPLLDYHMEELLLIFGQLGGWRCPERRFTLQRHRDVRRRKGRPDSMFVCPPQRRRLGAIRGNRENMQRVGASPSENDAELLAFTHERVEPLARRTHLRSLRHQFTLLHDPLIRAYQKRSTDSSGC